MNMKQMGWLMVGAVVGVLVACSGSSSADTGLTQAQVQTMITAAVSPLQSEIADLQAQVKTLQASGGDKAAVFIRAPHASAVIAQSIQRRGLRSLAISNAVGGGSTLPSPCNWTLTGRPPFSNPMSSNIYSGISCTGYYFNVSGATSAGVGVIQTLPATAYAVAFDGANCTGDAYLIPKEGATASALQIVAQSGAVFLFDPQGGYQNNDDPSNAALYWYLKAGATPTTVNVASWWWDGLAQPCDNSAVGVPGFNLTAGYPIQQNDPSVTGIPSAPIPGPVLIGN